MATRAAKRPVGADFESKPLKSPEQVRRERVLAIAHGEAIKAGCFAVLIGGAGSVAATKFSPAFAKYMSVSAKVSLPVMAGMFFFSLRYEHAISAVSRNPAAWGIDDGGVSSAGSKATTTVSTMPIHHRALNFLYDNTFSVILCAGAPFAAFILSQNLKHKHLTLSQSIMHSRVMAQAGILTIGLTTLGFRDYMEKRGRFPEPGE